MITYPLTLKSQPEQEGVLHRFQVIEGDTEGNGCELISTRLRYPPTKNSTDVCLFCGATIEMPDGSLEAHLKKYQTEHGGKDAIVRIHHGHKGPGATIPAGKKSDVNDPNNKSINEYVEMLEAAQNDPDSSTP